MTSSFMTLAFVMAIAMWIPHQLLAQPPKNSMEEIVAAWTKRQAEFKTATLAWKERQTVKKGVYLTRPTGKLSDKPAEPNPPEDYTFEYPCALTFSDDKLRFDSKPQIWAVEPRKWVVDPYVCTFDGTKGRSFHDIGLDRFPTGVIRGEDRHIEHNNYHLMSVLMTFRPVHPKNSPMDHNRLKTTGNMTLVGDSQCVELMIPEPSSRAQTLMWVDPKKQFSLVRYEHRSDDKLRLRITTTYELDKMHGWLPNKWDGIVIKPDGQMKLSFHSTVQHYQINQAVPNSEFEIEYPEGTRVFDQSQPQTKTYVVKADGQPRLVRGNELARLSEDIFSSDPPSPIDLKKVILVSGLSITIAVVVFWFVRSRYRRPPDSKRT